MLGLFDSGSGGLNTVRYIKEMSDDIDLVYLIDRERAPYGIKTKKELISIAESNIQKLCDMGCERVLIACMTASTVYPYLKEEYRKIALPIIDAVANKAKNSTRSGHIGLIATDRTVRSRAFDKALRTYKLHSLALGELVGMIDSGLSDKTVTEKDISELGVMLAPILSSGIDTLILGCTHFPSLKGTIGRIAEEYGITSLIDSAQTGAELLIKTQIIK